MKTEAGFLRILIWNTNKKQKMNKQTFYVMEMCKKCKHFFKFPKDESAGWQAFCVCPLPKWIKGVALLLDTTNDDFLVEPCSMFKSKKPKS